MSHTFLSADGKTIKVRSTDQHSVRSHCERFHDISPASYAAVHQHGNASRHSFDDIRQCIHRCGHRVQIACAMIRHDNSRDSLLDRALSVVRIQHSFKQHWDFDKRAQPADVPPSQSAAGNPAEAVKTLQSLSELSKQRYIPAYYFAIVHAGLGQKDQAFAWLEKSYQERSNYLLFLNVIGSMVPLRSDPRFQDLVRRIGLPP